MIAGVIFGVVLGLGLYYLIAVGLNLYVTRKHNELLEESLSNTPPEQIADFRSPKGH